MVSSDRNAVLFLTHNYPRCDGDFAGRFVARLAELTVQRGTSVAVCAPHHAGAAERETENGVEVHRFRYAADPDEVIAYRGELGSITLTGNTSPFAYRRFWQSFADAAGEIARDFHPHLIHAHWWLPAGMIARGLDFDGPLIVTLHGTDLRLLERKAWLRPLASRVFKRATMVTLVSSWLAKSLESIVPWLAPKIQITPMPPNDDAFKPADKSESTDGIPTVLSVTRFTEQKRNGILLKAVALLKKQGTGCTLQLVGEGPLRTELERQILADGLADTVTLIAPVPQTELSDLYRRADLVVLPAVDEGFGMALVEAQMCGTAVVGVRSGGSMDIITDGQTGLLARPDDAVDLSEVLGKVLSDASLRADLAQRGLESARAHYTSAAIVDKFQSWYETGRETA